MRVVTDAPRIRQLIRRRYGMRSGRATPVRDVREHLEGELGRDIPHRRVNALMRQVYPGVERGRTWIGDPGQRRRVWAYMDLAPYPEAHDAGD